MSEDDSSSSSESKSRIEQMLEEGEEESDISFSPSEIEAEYKQAGEKTKSQWVMGVFGGEGTAKSGAMLDLRTPEEIENGTKIVVIDIDNSCKPLWEEIWNHDPGIRILNPLVKVGEGTDKRPSYIASYRKTIALLSWIEESIEEEDIGYVVVDGFDTFLKWCEYIMKDVEYGDIDIENSEVGYDWGKRNRRYYRVLDWLKSLPIPTFVTAHRDEQKNFNKGTIEDRGPNWHKGSKQNTADELYQIIEMKKNVRQRGAYEVATYIGEVHKWKGNVGLEQKKIKVLESKTDPTGDGSDDEYTWYGLIPKIRKYLEEAEKSKKPPTGHHAIEEETKETDDDSFDGNLLGDEEEKEDNDLTNSEEELLDGLNENGEKEKENENNSNGEKDGKEDGKDEKQQNETVEENEKEQIDDGVDGTTEDDGQKDKEVQTEESTENNNKVEVDDDVDEENEINGEEQQDGEQDEKQNDGDWFDDF